MNKKMQQKQAEKFIDEYIVAIIAIIGLVIIETIALYKGVNGTMMIMICSIIAGLGGWVAPQLKLNN